VLDDVELNDGSDDLVDIEPVNRTEWQTRGGVLPVPSPAQRALDDRARLADPTRRDPATQKEEYVNFGRHELDAQLARRRPLRDWVLLSAVCLGLAGVISGRKLFQAIWTDTTYITFCIATVFLIAFVKSFADVRFIDREFRRTDSQNRLLWSTNNIKLFLARAEPSIFRNHVANLATIFRRDDLIYQDNLVELMHARLRARVRPLDVASSVMVSLGLVGTIVGLIASVGGLGTAMTHAGADQSGLMAGMNSTLGGMGTAFSATLMGSIFGGVILRLIYTNVSGQTEHLVAHIAEITEVHLLPVLRDAARERRAVINGTAKAAPPINDIGEAPAYARMSV
jgi:hypothetical protein